jgi:hypothetical protein
LELLKEAVPKIASVAVLHDPVSRGSQFELKEGVESREHNREWMMEDARSPTKNCKEKEGEQT